MIRILARGIPYVRMQKNVDKWLTAAFLGAAMTHPANAQLQQLTEEEVSTSNTREVGGDAELAAETEPAASANQVDIADPHSVEKNLESVEEIVVTARKRNEKLIDTLPHELGALP